MRLKLDENLSQRLEDVLVPHAHDVDTVAEEGLASQPDTRIVEEATRENRMLLTLDVGIADARAYPPGTHPGIILFRPPSFGPLTVNRFVEDYVAGHDLGRAGLSRRRGNRPCPSPAAEIVIGPDG